MTQNENLLCAFDKGQKPKSYCWTNLFINLRLFIQNSQIQLTPSHLPISISSLIISAFFFFFFKWRASKLILVFCTMFSQGSHSNTLLFIYSRESLTQTVWSMVARLYADHPKFSKYLGMWKLWRFTLIRRFIVKLIKRKTASICSK